LSTPTDGGEIVFRSSADDARLDRIRRIEPHEHPLGRLNVMMVGYHVPGAIPDKTAAGALRHSGGEEAGRPQLLGRDVGH
jgi:hypothetical protein